MNSAASPFFTVPAPIKFLTPAIMAMLLTISAQNHSIGSAVVTKKFLAGVTLRSYFFVLLAHETLGHFAI
jgi:hypothetical protein